MNSARHCFTRSYLHDGYTEVRNFLSLQVPSETLHQASDYRVQWKLHVQHRNYIDQLFRN